MKKGGNNSAFLLTKKLYNNTLWINDVIMPKIPNLVPALKFLSNNNFK
jgi:hypothetical protein